MLKKVFICSFVFILLFSSLSLAQTLIGARAAGMGGVGVATSFDIYSAYYNPAGIMSSGTFGFSGSLGAAYSGFDKLLSAVAGSSDLAKFISDNYTNSISVNGSVLGLLGFNVSKVGLSVIPNLSVNLEKTANSLVANGAANGFYSGVITFGKSFSVPVLPSLNVGANIKYLGGAFGNISIDNTAAGTEQYGNRSGFGLDIGALTTFNVPLVTSISVGIVARDLFESITTYTKQKTLTPSADGQSFVAGAEQDLGASTTTVDSSYALGVSGKIPGIGLILGADYETGKSFSNTHFGLEYPVVLNMLVFRAGVASGTNLSLTTLGAKIGLPMFTLNTAWVMNNKDSKNSSIIFDFGAMI